MRRMKLLPCSITWMSINIIFNKRSQAKDMEATYVLIDRGMDKEDVVHIYNKILLAIKKNEIMPSVAPWMDLEIIILSEVRKGKILYEIPYMWNLKRNDKNELIYKIDSDL